MATRTGARDAHDDRGPLMVGRMALTQAAGSNAWRLFAALFLLACVYLALTGHAGLLLLAVYALAFMVLVTLLTASLTAGAPAPPWEAAGPATRAVWVQTILTVAVLAALGLGVPPLLANLHVPGLVSSAIALAAGVLALVIVLALGARRAEIGLGRGHRSLVTSVALVLPPLALLAVGLILGRRNPLLLLLSPLAYIPTPGFSEEMSSRGVLMTRLVRIAGVPWGVVLAALIFGLLHVEANLGSFHASLLTSLAVCIVFQAIFGVTLSVVLIRTRNIVAGMLFHATFDAATFTLLPLLLPVLTAH